MLHALVQPCSCINGLDRKTGVERCWRKCKFHREAGGKSGIAYHEEMGAIKDGLVMSGKYIEELTDALKELDGMPPRGRAVSQALEIGCGVGVYIKWLRALGYRYIGIEPDAEVAQFTQKHFGNRKIGIQPKRFEDFISRTRFNLILACHVFEHMQDSPEMMRRCHGMLDRGGKLIILVPDDEDKTNPDHFWFANGDQWKKMFENAGFKNVRFTVRRRVAHENFIYLAADK